MCRERKEYEFTSSIDFALAGNFQLDRVETFDDSSTESS